MEVKRVNLMSINSTIRVVEGIIVLATFIFLFFGCETSKKITTPEPITIVAEERIDSLKPFEQKFRKNLKIVDSITFYNNTEIEILKSIDEEYNYVQDGIIFSIDSNKIAKFVPKLTACKLLSIKFKQGTNIIDVIIVSSTKNKVEYIFNYFRRGSLPVETIIVNGVQKKVIIEDPETFILGGNAMLKYKNQLYKIDVTPNKRCYLFVDYRKIVAQEDSSEEGWTR